MRINLSCGLREATTSDRAFAQRTDELESGHQHATISIRVSVTYCTCLCRYRLRSSGYRVKTSRSRIVFTACQPTCCSNRNTSSNRLSVDYDTRMIQKSTVSNNNAMPRRARFAARVRRLFRPAKYFPTGLGLPHKRLPSISSYHIASSVIPHQKQNISTKLHHKSKWATPFSSSTAPT
jgi:hypothetical protein